MIKEFAFGVSNRHHFQESDKMSDWMGLERDTFVSLYDYDKTVIEYYAKHKSLAGFDGPIYMPEEFILDVDGDSIDNAKEKTIGLLILLNDLDVPYRTYFSGTGFHVGIPGKAFKCNPDKNLHIAVKNALSKAGIFEYADPSVTDKSRIVRLLNTKNSKSNLWKVWIEDIHNTDKGIKASSLQPSKIPTETLECEPVFDATVKVKKENTLQLVSKDTKHHTCIQKMMEGAPKGKRPMVALRIGSYLRWRFPEYIVRLIMETWRKKVSNDDIPFKKEEMDKIVDGCYTGHNGEGYRYGWDDPIVRFYCDSSCKLHGGRRTLVPEAIMDATSMENELIEFYKQDIKPLNLGAIYGQDFPIYPGEVVILQAPPASMKTMLLQNWMNEFKRPTYFLEMEMSPRQIWSRFVMIENNWNEEQLVTHYKQMKNGMEEKFKWLTVDYSAPYASELEKRLAVLENKPEIVVVDHMGLFKSKQKDNNMKVEEVSQQLMEIAVKHKIILFAVSEITKQAFHEGMNMASSRGSFRIAYNANKLLSLSPYKNKKTGLIEMIRVKSDKNREKEHLDVKLSVNNVKITKEF